MKEKLTLILCAAGSGSRAGLATNKVLCELNGLPVLSYSLSAFESYADEILVVCRREDEEKILPLLSPYPQARIICGGPTRAHSVYNALKEATGEIVLVHDAARPFVEKPVIAACIQSVKKYGSGVAALPATDTTVLATDDYVQSTLPRQNVYSVQTPQGFERKALLLAYESAMREGKADAFTDDSGIYHAYVKPPHLSQGGRANKKLTYKEDFLPERVGFGVDTHRFETEGEGLPFTGFIVLGGEKLSSPKRLVAHSDGDVLVHALMDALLSAAGLDDIGHYFPDTDEAWAGADSMELLNKVMELIGKKGYKVKNASLSVLCEFPRLAPHIGAMKQNIAAALSVKEDAVGIAAGTNEKLGYVGEGKGITCYAAVLIDKKQENR